jgi:hypothetical protein
MNCQECTELITDLARCDLLDSRERDNAIEHISICEPCAARLERERALQAALHELKSEDVALEARSEIRANLQFAFRAQSPVEVVARPGRARNIAAGLAAAAVLTLAVAAASYWSSSRITSQVSKVEPPNPTAPRERPASPERRVTPPPNRGETLVVLPKGTRKHTARTGSVLASNTEYATVTSEVGEFRPVRLGVEVTTDFIPLRETSGLPPSESGQVIRIEMPRSALAYFGLPVASELPGQKVKADVLMADDGLARAIRFVR